MFREFEPNSPKTAKKHLHSKNVPIKEVFVNEECGEGDEVQQLQCGGEEGGYLLNNSTQGQGQGHGGGGRDGIKSWSAPRTLHGCVGYN